MTDIYDLHERAFPNVAAYVILHGSEKVATIAFKYPRDGAGRLYAYVHWFGVEMVRGFAGGYGYDKHSAACADAARKMNCGVSVKSVRIIPPNLTDAVSFVKFLDALARDDGQYWNRNLELAGFTVLRAV
jgi:hypothetical protein